MMARRLSWVLALCLLGFASRSLTADPSPEELLKRHGIRLHADQVTLEAETSLIEKVAEAGKTRASLVAARNSLVAAQKNLLQIQQQIAQGNVQKQVLQNQLMNIDDCPDSPVILRLQAQIQELDAYLQKLAANMDSGPPARQLQSAKDKIAKGYEELTTQLKATREVADQLTQQYAQLAQDGTIPPLLDQLNKDQKKSYKMVESRAFQNAKQALKSLETALTNMEKIDAKNGVR